MSSAVVGAAEHTVSVLGEIHTCLLPSRNVLDTSAVVELLGAVKPGSTVTSRERPVPLVVSPNRVEGVDCLLIPALGKQVHIIGTVAAHVVVVGGRILQSSTMSRVIPTKNRARQPWSHYLSMPGTVEAVSKLGADAGARLADGFLRPGGGDRLDLTSISQRMSTSVRVDPRLDQGVPFRAGTTRLRWAVEIGAPGERPGFVFRLDTDSQRSVRLIVPAPEVAAAQRFCEDLAVHDWLLTTIGQVADRFGPVDQEVGRLLDQLAPVLEQLAPLWMPGAHTPAALRGPWAQLEADPGFTRQWTARVGQLRDRMTTATLHALRNSKISSSDW
ncbi:SCO2521 family protein [Nocardia sp. BMG111209]|uniref:SCO2521 family protein n=1 Tax=Nocardia sp. BMG111209 TaxID=1160137 RepID=UPI00037656D8|nr:SCO2521 family protein [Nocardia sp. BMG111209]